MRVAIVDDESQWLDVLEQAIRNSVHWRGTKIAIDRFTSAQGFIDSVKSGTEYNFIFLDIHIPDINGIRVFHQLPKPNEIPVIFVSTYTEELPSIYKLYPAAFLHKPYKQETFDRTVKVVLLEINDNTPYEYQVDDKVQLEKLKNIICFAVANHNVTMKTVNGFMALPRKSLDAIEEQLSKFGFLRCHRAYLINMRYYYERTQKEVFIKYNGKTESLPLSKYKKDDVDRACLAYNTEGEYAF
jgi:DNA-binding LytR/AlgR family response regulator